MEVEDLQALVESNKPSQVEDLKKKFYDQFNTIKEPWLLNGLFDCYLQTSSLRLVEVLVGVREPHDRHLFDKLSETLRGPSKLQALTLLGHVVRRHPTPTWLIKITQHQLLKDLLRVLKNETDILLLMSALLIVIILLPMIPSLMAPHLQEIFDVFSRLAAWNTNNPNKVPEENLLHLQVGLCELFHRLYGMYPCNFLFYLRQQYSQREHLDVFSHTIKPMVCSVRMHPLLVTASKDAEIAANRWKKMEDHDVIVECAKYVLDASRDEFCPVSSHTPFRSRSVSDYASNHDSPHSFFSRASELALTSGVSDNIELNPSVLCGLNTPPPPESTPTSIPHTPVSQNYIVNSAFPHPEGTSPPEAAIEATPETTPIKDHRLMRHPPAPANVVRALNHSLSIGGGTVGTSAGVSHKWAGSLSVSSTSYSQPSSPMKKESSPFRFSGINQPTTATPPPTFPMETSAFQQPRRDSLPSGANALLDKTGWEPSSINRRLNNLIQERKQASFDNLLEKPISAGNVRPRSSICVTSASSRLPSSPLRVISNAIGIPSESPVPIEPTAPVPGSRDWPVTRPTPEKNGQRLESSEVHRTPLLSSPHPQHLQHGDPSQEDQEIVEIVRQGETLRNQNTPLSTSRLCDSVLQEFPANPLECELDGEECQQEASGSPCASGGLHMPNSVMNFTRRASRMRYFSQCLPGTVAQHLLQDANGSSPGDGESFLVSTKVRRANSCPEMEKTQTMPSGSELKFDRTVEEREECDENSTTEEATTPQNSIGEDIMVNGCNHDTPKPEMKSEGTQTTDHPYEHLFQSVFSPLEARASPMQSPTPIPLSGDYMLTSKLDNGTPQGQLELYLGKMMENRPRGTNRDVENRLLKEQVMLLSIQLQFERQRREVHAERNRRLLGRSRNNRALEEHKTALKEQLNLLQRELDLRQQELAKLRRDSHKRDQELQDSVKYWQEQCNQAQKNWREVKNKCELLEQRVRQEQDRTAVVQKDYQLVQSKLFDISNEKQQAEASASAAERLRAEVQHLNRELLLSGELQQRLHERLQQSSLSSNKAEEIAIQREAFYDELNNMRQLLDNKSALLAACQARLGELEVSVNNAAMHIGDKKRQLKCVKDEYNDKLEAVESKYKAQKKINQRLQEENLDLLRQRAELQVKFKRKREVREPSASQPAATSPSSHSAHPKSPDSACSDDRLPHSSSPLSESLSSSEGMSLTGILAKDVLTLQNLQKIVDQSETSDIVQSKTTVASESRDEG